MAIGSALERGSFICVYDEHGRTLFGAHPKTGAAWWREQSSKRAVLCLANAAL